MKYFRELTGNNHLVLVFFREEHTHNRIWENKKSLRKRARLWISLYIYKTFRRGVLIFRSYVQRGDGTNLSPPEDEAINLAHAPDGLAYPKTESI